ncbi:hypothetical protein [Acidovorax sp.]|jgi:hypothetical protein|uniref:hypothetical protein n=1 Tax=Acidovorax sp. TaxID=1872122 RepID=UPI00391FB640
MAKSNSVTTPTPLPAKATASASAAKDIVSKRNAAAKVAGGAPKAAPRAKSAASKSAPKAQTPTKAKPPAVQLTAQPAAADKEAKARKPKLVRDSFTFPKDEYAAIEALKERLASLGQPVKKSELLRAGLKALAGMPDTALRTALQAVPSLKTGRPKA